MRVVVDRERCVGSGTCVLTEPGVFDQDERDGRVVLLAAGPPRELWETVLEAERFCPTGAVTVTED
ncbi:ferredoxin [Amycolatopsis samaneae]|uniref:Ferredoxin n=1 Tax=Amycolatopsis samaneae TaxID=664691 RepID=A0ABW5GCN2_9PSEU